MNAHYRAAVVASHRQVPVLTALAALFVAGAVIAGVWLGRQSWMLIALSVLGLLSALLALGALLGGARSQRLSFEDSGSTRVFKSDTEGMILTAPWQGKPVFAEKVLPLGELEDQPAPQEPVTEMEAGRSEAAHASGHGGSQPVGLLRRFNPGRLVIDFRLVDANGALMTQFHPPLKLEVAFGESDVEAAGGLDRLALASVSHHIGRWYVFGEEDGFEIFQNPNRPGTGYCVVSRLSGWDDRHIGIGGS